MSVPRENKFAAFFRARSRSRSRSRPPDATNDVPPSSYALRAQTRPVSSTTTATHSTITPLPSDSLKNRLHAARHPYLADTHTALPPYDPDDHTFPRSETPSSTRSKPIFPSFFGISFSRRSSSSAHQSDRKPSFSTSSASDNKSSRKHSFRLSSRPSTPKSTDDSSKSPYAIPVPSGPLPLTASPRRRSFGLGSSHRSTPKSSTTNLPLPPAPSPRSHGRRHSVGSERPPHDSAVALAEEPSHRTVHKPAQPLIDTPRNKGKEREKSFTDRPLPDLPPPFHSPSHSLPSDPSPLLSSFRPSPVSPQLPTLDTASPSGSDPLPHPLPAIPRIIHTPPTPQRPGEDVDSPQVDFSNVDMPKPKAVSIAHREQVIISTSHPLTDIHHTPLSKARFTPRIFGGKDLPKSKDTHAGRRPPTSSADASPHKSPAPNIPGPARNMTSHRSKLGSFDFERPVSALNRSSSTVDRYPTTDNSSFSKARLHSLERTISEDSARGAVPQSAAHHPGLAESLLSQLKPVHTGDTSVLSFSSVSVQTTSTGKGVGTNIPEGQSSSWGRGSGKRIMRTSHGSFAFEHPSSVPGSPSPPNFNLPVTPNQNQGPVQSQPSTPLHSFFDTRLKHSRGRSHNTSDHVEPGHSKPSERKPKGKGRSLDLGLGLSWAPSRLREEVLMPGLILAREKAKVEKTKASGSDVTKVFESILSESRFQAFKEYVHRFDAHIIPLGGSSGLLARVEKLLADSGLSERERNKLMSDFAVFVENHNG